jgi:hypothetical protein
MSTAYLPITGRRPGLGLGLAIIGCLLLLAGVSTAHAQLAVRAVMGRKLYLAGEAVKIEITVTNMAGRDVLLRGSAGQPWLGFDLRTMDGEMVTTKGRPTEHQDLTILAGESLKRTVSLSDAYPMQQAGDFKVRAYVYFADLKQFLYSGDSQFTVAPGRTIWTQTVGVPLDRPDGGNFRTYELQTLQEVDRLRVCALVKERTSGQLVQCYTLGNAISVVNPQAAIDSANLMHVMYMSAPQVLHHVIVRYDGALVASDKYRVTTKYPRLVRASTGEIGVMGGVKLTAATLPTDPATGETQQPSMLSDRPE